MLLHLHSHVDVLINRTCSNSHYDNNFSKEFDQDSLP